MRTFVLPIPADPDQTEPVAVFVGDVVFIPDHGSPKANKAAVKAALAALVAPVACPENPASHDAHLTL